MGFLSCIKAPLCVYGFVCVYTCKFSMQKLPVLSKNYYFPCSPQWLQAFSNVKTLQRSRSWSSTAEPWFLEGNVQKLLSPHKQACNTSFSNAGTDTMKTSLSLKKNNAHSGWLLSFVLIMQPIDVMFRFSFTQVSKSQKGRSLSWKKPHTLPFFHHRTQLLNSKDQ